jgi:hypothetical protein
LAEILRFFLAPGHGLSNAVNGRFDPGATSPHGSEYDIVVRVAHGVFDRVYEPDAEYSTVLTPVCSTDCVQFHPLKRDGERAGHLAYVIDYINRNCAKFDLVVALHMNAAASSKATGVECLYSDKAPAKRRVQAAVMAETFAREVGLLNRGAKPDTESARKALAILGDTNCPALLLEMGFVTNECDVEAVRERGEDALIAAMHAVRGVR